MSNPASRTQFDSIRVISVTAWWAWAIVHAGKDIENRTWSTSYRGPLLIHASKTVLDEDLEIIDSILMEINPSLDPDLRHRPGPPAGGIVGRCTLADCVTRHDSPWFFGLYGFVLTDVQATPFIPMRGRLGIFNAPADVLAQLETRA